MMHLLIVARAEAAVILTQHVRDAGVDHTTSDSREEALRLLALSASGFLKDIYGVIIDEEIGAFETGAVEQVVVSSHAPEQLTNFLSRLQGHYERESTLDEPMLASLRKRWIERAAKYQAQLQEIGATPSFEHIELIRRIAHTLRGTAESFGFAAIGMLATEVEETIKRGDLQLELDGAKKRLQNALAEIPLDE